MDKSIKVTFRLETKEFKEGTTFKDISESFKHYFDYDILVAKVDNDIVDLSETLKKKCTVEFYDRSSILGSSIYARSARFILILATRNVLGDNIRLVTEHSMDHGVYCTIHGVEINKSIIKQIEKEMKDIVKHDYIYTKISVSRIDAIKYYKKLNQMDKVNVLKYISNTNINLYRINDIYDYFHGKMAYSTSQINDFKLTYIKDNGFVMSLPEIVNPECTLDYTHHEKVFDKFLEYTKWGSAMGVSNASDLNKVVSKGKVTELISLAEAHYNAQLSKVADNVASSKDKIKLVLIAGPSSSGKTTTARKLNYYLEAQGIITHSISIDDYFYDKENRKCDEFGNCDLESLDIVDVDLFNKHLIRLLDGEKVEIPTFNFALGKREYKGKSIQLKENDVIVIEGLHALNDKLTMSIDRENKYKIYISPLTQMNIDDHNHIHTSDTRKLRRIVRDSRARGKGAKDTLKMWPSIKRGERNYIFPFQDEVDQVINSSLIYELGVLKTYAEPLLFNVSEDDEVYPEALRLINFLRNFLPIPSDDIPVDSVLREFIGGSCYRD